MADEPDQPQVSRSRMCKRCGYELKGLPVPGYCPECGRAYRELQSCLGCGGDRLIAGTLNAVVDTLGTFTPYRRRQVGFLSAPLASPIVTSAACRDCGLVTMYCNIHDLEDYVGTESPADGGGEG